MPDSGDPISNAANVRQIRRLRLPKVIAIASSLTLFACAGCCFLSTIVLRPQVINTPEGATEIAARINDWTLPAGFTGKMGIVQDFGVLIFEVAKFQHEQGRGTLVIGQFQSRLLQISGQRDQLQELTQRTAPELRKIKFDDLQKRTLTIHNLPATFEIGRGEDLASKSRYQQITGFYRGKVGDVILTFQCEEGILSDQEIDDFLKSIH